MREAHAQRVLPFAPCCTVGGITRPRLRVAAKWTTCSRSIALAATWRRGHRLQSALAELVGSLFRQHPLRWLGKGYYKRTAAGIVDQALGSAEDLIAGIESGLELSGLPGELWGTFEKFSDLGLAVQARPLSERNLLGC